MALVLVAALLIFLGLMFLLKSSRQQRAAGLPTGRVIYSDTGARRELEKPLYDAMLQLTGKPDYLVEQDGKLIPVEVKSTWAPATPYPSHIYQLAVYCLLVERSYHRRPPYGVIKYRNRSIAVDYTPQLEASLLDHLMAMRQLERSGVADRSHEDPARCARCGYRSLCDQRL